MLIPRLKAINCIAGDGSLLLGLDPHTRLEVADPTGQVRALLLLLREGTRTPARLLSELAKTWPDVGPREVDEALDLLDGLGWLENAAAAPCLSDYERERYFSNLAYFDAFTTLALDREEIQRRLVASHVVVLGAGGLGSSVIQNLCGLGVGRLTLLDQDTVELRSFARQFTYGEADLGMPKVEQVGAWLRAFDSHAAVAALHKRIDGPDDVAALLSDADLVVAAIDEPAEVDEWINAACARGATIGEARVLARAIRRRGRRCHRVRAVSRHARLRAHQGFAAAGGQRRRRSWEARAARGHAATGRLRARQRRRSPRARRAAPGVLPRRVGGVRRLRARRRRAVCTRPRAAAPAGRRLPRHAGAQHRGADAHVLLARYGDGAGWWDLRDGTVAAPAAIAFIEVTAIASQCWIFLRTDLYAVLITATGCVNLVQVNRLLVRRAGRRITPAQRDELTAAPERDLAVRDARVWHRRGARSTLAAQSPATPT